MQSSMTVWAGTDVQSEKTSQGKIADPVIIEEINVLCVNYLSNTTLYSHKQLESIFCEMQGKEASDIFSERFSMNRLTHSENTFTFP